MPKLIPTRELDAIVSVIGRFLGGVGAEAIREGLSLDLHPRTFQRRLNLLQKEGRITSSGSGKGKRYFPISTNAAPPALAPIRVAESEDEGIPLSVEAREIRMNVRAGLGHRTPVGYDPDFLGRYVPNRTAYLPEETRAELARLGQVGVTDLPAGTYFRQVLDRLRIDLSWNSSRLEGNTYSLLETERLLERGESPGGKNAEETQMILNHKAAIEMLADQADEIGFNRYTLCNLHALLAEGLLSDPASCGRVRSIAVGIGGTVFHPLEVPQLIEEHFLEILTKAETISDPFEQAFFAMVHLPYLQPFEDVNKRVSRLAANIPLVKYNLCPLSFIDVAPEDYVSGLIGIYELNRIDYLRDVFVWAYQRSSARYSAVVQSLGRPDLFRMRHRTALGEFVRAVVLAGMDKGEAARWIAQQAAVEVPEEDRARFVGMVETELVSLHEGNIARFQLRPRPFQSWWSQWR